MELSVIICTYNPNRGLLLRVTEALRHQTLSMQHWELIVVDNKSDSPVANLMDWSWHPHCRNIFEEKPGLTHARLAGIKESKTSLLVFVDDDNILNPDYLEVALRISSAFPWMGAWGGSCIGEFEVDPPPWFHIATLGVREFDKDHWSNSTETLIDCPIGAGLVIRKEVAEKYAVQCESNPIRRLLDRSGQTLLGAGDFDMAFTACDLGFGRGVFKDLRLIHYIPAKRLTKEYFLKMKEGLACSLIILFSIRKGKPQPYHKSRRKRIVEYFKQLRMTTIEREILKAKDSGRRKALTILSESAAADVKSAI